jgi:hypothetical protein
LCSPSVASLPSMWRTLKSYSFEFIGVPPGVIEIG